MYIKAWRNKKFHWQRKAALWPMEGTPPCFAVCALVCDPVGEGECVLTFTHESKRGPFVPETSKSV